ncbi:MAG TPA: hypothetical protein VHC19_05435 [Pirellulales bacterium]|nr:hypothetical protein [Pirellulales bacterium]
MADWQNLLERVVELARDHWAKALGWAAAFLFSTVWASLLARRSWRNRQDLDVIHVSQNTIARRPTGPKGEPESWLVLDVHFEDPLEQVISHPIPRRLIRRAAKRTTEKQPFLLFPADDRWYVLNLVRLAIAEPFKVGAAAKMIPGARVEEVPCVFAITFERYPGMRQGKIRVMLVPKTLLEDPNSLTGPLRLEAESHRDRVKTLLAMQEDYAKGAEAKFCMDVRLSVVI